MTNQEMLSMPSYDPNKLMDYAITGLRLKNDAQLSRKLEVAPPVISRIRHKKLPVGPATLLRLHELLDIPVRELRAIMGVAAGAQS